MQMEIKRKRQRRALHNNKGIKRSIQKEIITIINIYAPKIGAPKHIKQILRDIKGEINSNTKVVGDFNTPLALMDRLSRQKITEETQGLNDIRLNGINKYICIEQST